jgi:hypothetical protein
VGGGQSTLTFTDGRKRKLHESDVLLRVTISRLCWHLVHWFLCCQVVKSETGQYTLFDALAAGSLKKVSNKTCHIVSTRSTANCQRMNYVSAVCYKTPTSALYPSAVQLDA